MARQKDVIVNISSWPEADRDAWERAIGRAGLFDDVGAAAHWSEGSRKSVSYGYGRWIGHLRDTVPDALARAAAACDP